MTTQINPEQQEFVEITKNTKGYNWTIKLVAIANTNLIDRLEFVDKELRKRFGNNIQEVDLPMKEAQK